MTERDWSHVGGGGSIHGIELPKVEKKTPLTECPNCGKYQYTDFRRQEEEEVVELEIFGFVLSKREKVKRDSWETWAECEHCELYEEDVDV